MKKFFSRIICFVLFVFVMVSCSACSDGAQVQSQIDELKTKIQQQQTEIANLQNKNADLEEKNDELQKSVIELEEMYEAIKFLAYSPYGIIMDCELAYNLGWLTYEDLKSAAYYHNGGNGNNTEIIPEDYEPQPLEPLSEEKAFEIRETHAYDLRRNGEIAATNANVDIKEYCGYYDGIYILRIEDDFTHAPTVESTQNIGGVEFHFPCGYRLSVFIESSDYRFYIYDEYNQVFIGSKAEEYTRPNSQEIEVIINTWDELQMFLNANPYIDREQYEYFKESFFENTALIFYSFASNTSGGALAYVGCYKYDDTVRINIVYDEGTENESTNVLVAVSINKSDLEGIEDFRVTVS